MIRFVVRWLLCTGVLAACTDLHYDRAMEDGGIAGSAGDLAHLGGSGGGVAGTSGQAGVAVGGGMGGVGGQGGGAAGVSGQGGAGGQGGGVAGPCMENALRCVASGSSGRELCQSGQFVATDPCPNGQICDQNGAAGPGSCSDPFALCVGHADQDVCDGADLHHCNADALSTGSETCGSDRLCQAGLLSGVCAVCLVGTYHCDGVHLQRCAADGMSWESYIDCDTPDLCKDISGACTASACLPGDKTCSGDVLQTCNASQDGFETLETCDPGQCDPVGKDCDTCVPDTSICNDAADGYRVCDSDGQAYTDTACPSDKHKCTGNGTCVQCTGNADCGGTTPYCVQSVCRPCNGTCAVAHACTQDSDCATNDCNGGKCRPACSGSCAVGDACVADDDCGSNECDPGSSTCTLTCGDVSLSTQADYDAARACIRINGNLTLPFNAAVVDPELPNVISISGSISPTYNTLNTNPITGVRLPALQSVGGDVILSATKVATISWPQLTSIGGQLAVISAEAITSFSAPKLASIGGATQFTLLPKLTRIDLRALKTIGGVVAILSDVKLDSANFSAIQSVSGAATLSALPYLSYRDVEAVYQASNKTQAASVVGCCLFGSTVTKTGCDSFDISTCSSL